MKRRILLSLFALIGGALSASAASVVVTPNNESVAPGKKRQMTATVTGLTDSTVVWSVNGIPGGDTMSIGGISATGLYTAPANLSTPTALTITATSAMNNSVFGSAILNVRSPGPSLTSMTPTSAPTGSVTVTLTGTGFQPGTVVYLISAPWPTTYISPTQVKATGVVVTGNNFIRAANPNTMFSNILTLQANAPGSPTTAKLNLAPSSAIVPTASTQQFAATLNGSPAAVSWSATAGSITSAGLYTAPASVPNPSTVTITAAGANNAAASATVTIISNVPPVITQVNPSPVPTGVYSLAIQGSGFIQGSQVTMNGSALATQYVSPTQLTASGFAGGSTPGNLVVSNASINSQPFTVQIGVANPQVSLAAASRFLQQAAFGPSSAGVMRVQQLGFQGWLNEQFNLPVISNYQISANQGGMPQRFLTNAVMNQDQLRQKVAFALSQIWVTSLTKLIWNGDMIPYQQLLLADAFTNYRQIMKDVTLSPAMGYYLDMANNGKANAMGTVLPNENYSREVLQLFTIGTSQLNQNGTPITDSTGVPLPSYTQSTVTELARVFTGWTYSPANPGGPLVWNAYRNSNGPLQPYTAQHDFGSKQLWPNQPQTFIPAGLAPMQDLDAALDIIFQNPNMPPFIARQLIQHLVKSNPSPAYVKDIADTFVSSNGDMKAVITAILTHAEARQNDITGNEQPNDGHLQEPALFLAGLFRALGSQINDQNYFSSDLRVMGQDIFNPASVFNYFRPDGKAPGTGGVTGGEFQIYTPYTSVYRANLVGSLFNAYNNPVQSYGPGWSADLSAYVSLANTPQTLVDALDVSLMGGQMPSAMKSIIVTAVQNDNGGTVHRVQTAIYLIASSGYYNVWR